MELHETYKKIGLVLEDFEGDRFKRIAHIRKLIAEGSLDQNLRWTEKSGKSTTKDVVGAATV